MSTRPTPRRTGHRRRCTSAAVAAALSACGPAGATSGIDVSLSVAVSDAAPGDSVALEGVATNHGAIAVQAGAGCSPGIGFSVTGPDGTRRDLYADAVFTCEVKDSNVLDPGETDTVSWVWVPTEAGTYRIVATVLGEGGAAASSTPTTVTVSGPADPDGVAAGPMSARHRDAALEGQQPGDVEAEAQVVRLTEIER